MIYLSATMEPFSFHFPPCDCTKTCSSTSLRMRCHPVKRQKVLNYSQVEVRTDENTNLHLHLYRHFLLIEAHQADVVGRVTFSTVVNKLITVQQIKHPRLSSWQSQERSIYWRQQQPRTTYHYIMGYSVVRTHRLVMMRHS